LRAAVLVVSQQVAVVVAAAIGHRSQVKLLVVVHQQKHQSPSLKVSHTPLRLAEVQMVKLVKEMMALPHR
jgi:hypothetical protein